MVSVVLCGLFGGVCAVAVVRVYDYMRRREALSIGDEVSFPIGDFRMVGTLMSIAVDAVQPKYSRARVRCGESFHDVYASDLAKVPPPRALSEPASPDYRSNARPR